MNTMRMNQQKISSIKDGYSFCKLDFYGYKSDKLKN